MPLNTPLVNKAPKGEQTSEGLLLLPAGLCAVVTHVVTVAATLTAVATHSMAVATHSMAGATLVLAVATHAVTPASSISVTKAKIRSDLVGLKLEIDSHLIKLGPELADLFLKGPGFVDIRV